MFYLQHFGAKAISEQVKPTDLATEEFSNFCTGEVAEWEVQCVCVCGAFQFYVIVPSPLFGCILSLLATPFFVLFIDVNAKKSELKFLNHKVVWSRPNKGDLLNVIHERCPMAAWSNSSYAQLKGLSTQAMVHLVASSAGMPSFDASPALKSNIKKTEMKSWINMD